MAGMLLSDWLALQPAEQREWALQQIREMFPQASVSPQTVTVEPFPRKRDGLTVKFRQFAKQ